MVQTLMYVGASTISLTVHMPPALGTYQQLVKVLKALQNLSTQVEQSQQQKGKGEMDCKNHAGC